MGQTDERFLAFIVAIHVVLFYAGAAGVITNEQGDNPHAQVIDEFENQQLTKDESLRGESGIIQDTFSPIFAISGFINDLVGLITSPYTTLQATALPAFFSTMIGVIFGLMEILIAYRAFTGRL